jgi:hypothetical protein
LLTIAKRSPRTVVGIIGTQPTSAELIKELGGNEVASVLRSSDRVEAALIEPSQELRYEDPTKYRTISGPDLVASNTAASIGHTLLAPEEHRDLDVRKGCIPRYGVRVTFLAATDRVDVYFCFECAILAVYLNDKPVGGLNFDFAYRRLIADVQLIFPEHKGLAKLAKDWRF